MAFDLNDGDLIFSSGDTRFDSNGHLMHSMGGGLAMDMETGDLHFISGWDDEDEDD